VPFCIVCLLVSEAYGRMKRDPHRCEARHNPGFGRIRSDCALKARKGRNGQNPNWALRNTKNAALASLGAPLPRERIGKQLEKVAEPEQRVSLMQWRVRGLTTCVRHRCA